MRKFFYTLGIVAASALAFSACQKEQDVNNEPETTKLVTISFTAEKAGMETRTGIADEGASQVSYKWTAEDVTNIKLFTVDGSTLTQVANPTITKVSDDKLTISATVEANATYTFRAILAGEWDGNTPKLSADQTPNSTSKFDPTADILISDDKAVTVGAEGATGDMLLTFRRQVVVNRMTLKNLTAGEKISSVAISSNKELASGSTSLTVNYSDAVIPDSGEFVVYFVTTPNTGVALTVAVTTDKNTYSKSFAEGKSIDFNLGQFTKFNFALPVDNTPYYVKVTSAPSDWSGQYLIVYEESRVAFNGSLEKLDDVGNTIEVTINNSKILANQTTNASAFTIAPTDGGYTIKSASGYYIGQTSDANGLASNTSTSYVNSLSINEANADIISGGAYLRYNSASNQTRFRYYKSSSYTGQKAIQLYKLEDKRKESGLSWSASSAEASLEDNDVVVFTAPTLTTGNAHDVTYSSTDEDVATITATGVVTIKAEGTTTIQASFAGDENYKPATVGYTLTVTDNRTPSYDFETIADLNNLVTTESASYSGYLTNAVVSFVPATNTAIIKDETGSIMYYKSGHGLKQGQTFTGEITVDALLYNGYSEITNIGSATFSGQEASVAPETVTLAELIGHFDTNQNAYVQVSGLTVSSIDGKNINVTDGTNTYVVFDNTSSASCIVNDVITVVGTVTKYSTTEEIKVWNASDITITAPAPKAITFEQPAAGGSFTVSVGGSTITSGTTVASGTTVTLTATPATDYTFNGWTVNGASVANASAATTTFTMGTSAVSVSASFTSNSGGGTQKISTLSFTAKCNGSGTADDGVSWTVTSDGTESTFDNTKGIHYGTNSAQVQYIKLSTSGISGTITKVVVNASTASGVTATASVTVGGAAFGGNAQSLSATATDYTFNGSASGEIVVTVTKPDKAAKALYVKSVVVTYTN